MRIVLSDCWVLFWALLKGETGNISGRIERQGGNATHQILLSPFLLSEGQRVKVLDA